MMSLYEHILMHEPLRLCPGRQFGDAAVFLAVVHMIAALNIKKARDTQGKEITPEPRFMSGFVRLGCITTTSP